MPMIQLPDPFTAEIEQQIREVQYYVTATVEKVHGKGTKVPADPSFTATEALTHLIALALATNRDLERRLQSLERERELLRR
jgi:hypothetical protein